MSNFVPEGWRICNVDEFAKTSSGGTPNTQVPEYWSTGTVPWMSSGEVHKKRIKYVDQFISELGFKNSSAKLFPAKTILIALAGQGKTRGTVAISEVELTTNQSIAGVIVTDKTVFPDFVFHNLDSRYNELRSASGGSGRAGLNLSIIGEQELLLPPLPEQQKIATILSSVDDVIEKTRAQINKLKDLKTGMMQELLTKGIGHTEFKDSPVGLIPTTWKVLPLSDISTFRRGSFPQPYGKPEWYADNGFPFVQVYDIDNNGQLKKITKVTISEQAASKSVFAEKGSIIVSLQGSIGRVAITQYDAYIDRTILIFSNLSSELDKDYFAMLIEDIFQEKKEEADGGVIKTITKATLKNFSLKMPPKTEQEKISKAVRAIESKTLIVTEHLEKLILTKKALMQDLLTGKVRVNLTDKESAVV